MTRRACAVMALHYMLAFWGGMLAAQQAAPDPSADDEAIFAEGAFDAAVSSGKSAGESAVVSWLGGLTLVADGQATWLEERNTYGYSGTFSGKAFLKASQPDTAALFVSGAFTHTLAAATNDDELGLGWASLGPSLDTPSFALSELHLSFDFGKALFVRIGNQILSWGASYFWSPADFVNERPVDSEAAIDSRTGKTGARLHLPLDGANVFLFADFSKTLDGSGTPQDMAEKIAIAFRADATLLGFNTGILGAFGPSDPPRLGMTLSGKAAGLDVWGELGTVLPLWNHGFSASASLGGEKSLGIDGEWNLRCEFFYNGPGSADRELDPATRFIPYNIGTYYAYLSGTRLKLFGGSSSLGISGIMNVSDLSWTASASMGIRLPKLLPIDVSLRYSGGKTDREFTVAYGGPSWTFGVRSILQF